MPADERGGGRYQTQQPGKPKPPGNPPPEPDDPDDAQPVKSPQVYWEPFTQPLAYYEKHRARLSP